MMTFIQKRKTINFNLQQNFYVEYVTTIIIFDNSENINIGIITFVVSMFL